MKVQIQEVPNQGLPISPFSGYISIMKQKLSDLPTEDLVQQYFDLKQLSESRFCPYDVWIDFQADMEEIDEIIFQRQQDETSERYSQIDDFYNELMMSADWALTGPGYEEE